MTTCVVEAKVPTAVRRSHGNACDAVAQLCHRSVTAMICVPLGATWPIANTWRCCRRARPTTAAGESSRQEELREAFGGGRAGRSSQVACGAVERSWSGNWSRQASSAGAKAGGPEGCGAVRFLLMASDEFRSLGAVSALGVRIDSREASNQGRRSSHYFARTGESAAQKAWTNSL